VLQAIAENSAFHPGAAVVTTGFRITKTTLESAFQTGLGAVTEAFFPAFRVSTTSPDISNSPIATLAIRRRSPYGQSDGDVF
jgi:hypothetical protein